MKSKMKDTLLLVGDQSSDRARLHDIFEDSYHLLEAETPEQGVQLLKQNSRCIAAVIADIPLEREKGKHPLVKASQPDTESEIPVIFLVTPNGSGSREERAFMLGAADVVRKPYTSLSIQRRVQVLVDLYLHRWHLETQLQEQNERIRNGYQTIVETLSSIIEHRSMESRNHILRIRGFTKVLLQEVSRCCPEYGLDEKKIDIISSASNLHDIGKICIPDAILNKPGPLSKEEFTVMKTHTTLGSELVSQLWSDDNDDYVRYTYNICLYHHERWDGNGYPLGLKGEDIPICAQVVGVADCFDALTTQRVYKEAYPVEVAVNMILNGDCGIFSPKLLECFKRVREKLSVLATQYSDGLTPQVGQVQLSLEKPEAKTYSLDALHLSQLKYQALLHYVNDTIIELDVDNQIYHVVYNPNPEVVPLLTNASFTELGDRLMAEGVHPEEMTDIFQMQAMFSQRLFEKRQRKCVFHCRIFSPVHGQYQQYEVTLLRINTEDTSQKILIAVFHNLEQAESALPQEQTTLLDSPALGDMADASLCCSNDPALSILEGTGSLFYLTGYSESEIRDQFGNAFLNLVVPEDRERLLALCRKEPITEKRESQYRIFRKNGHPVWVLGRSRTWFAQDGTEYCCHTLCDISTVKKDLEKMERDSLAHQVLAAQSPGAIFQWDLETDTVDMSPKWEKRFGSPFPSSNFTKTIAETALLHPDDLPQMRQAIGALCREETSVALDVRITNSEGRYLWSRILATSLADKQGKIQEIIGIVHDIHELKTDALQMRRQAQQDGLTKLLNRASTEQRVMNYLAERREDALAAMVLLDVDNFKDINDHYGHLYGDAVLTQIAANLRTLFRYGDVIGRVGGDEFLVLLKDIPNPQVAEDRCKLLVETSKEQMQTLMPDLNVSVSAGCVLIPDHGTSWTELYRYADEALYSAKRLGKCRYKVYSEQDKHLPSATGTARSTTRIDSDENAGMQDEELVRMVFQSLYRSKNVEATIQELLALVGGYFNVSRVYIFENNEDNTCCSNTFEWCNAGIVPEKDNLQNLSYKTDIPDWQRVYDENGIFYCTDINQLEPEIYAVVEPQGIKSMLHCAIRDKGVYRGFVGFDECTTDCLWTQKQISLLEFFAEVLSLFLMKERNENAEN